MHGNADALTQAVQEHRKGNGVYKEYDRENQGMKNNYYFLYT